MWGAPTMLRFVDVLRPVIRTLGPVTDFSGPEEFLEQHTPR